MSPGTTRSSAVDRTPAPDVCAVSVSPVLAVDFQLAVIESELMNG